MGILVLCTNLTLRVALDRCTGTVLVCKYTFHGAAHQALVADYYSRTVGTVQYRTNLIHKLSNIKWMLTTIIVVSFF